MPLPPPAIVQVFTTLSAGLLPSNTINSPADVYTWLQGLLQSTWVDPVCVRLTCCRAYMQQIICQSLFSSCSSSAGGRDL